MPGLPEGFIPPALAARHGSGVLLAGDASTRQYARLADPNGESTVLCRYPKGEEKACGHFLATSLALTKAGIPVPRALAANPVQGWILWEDMGQTSLEDLVGEWQGEQIQQEYRQLLSVAARIQSKGPSALREENLKPNGELGKKRLNFEIDYFFEHGFDTGWFEDLVVTSAAETGSGQPGWSGEFLNQTRSQLQHWFEGLIDQVATFPQALVHRDFHSRNLHLVNKPCSACPEGGWMVLDFQDIRRGPRLYDAASLVEDPYADLPREERKPLRAHAIRLLGGDGYEYAMTALQRLFKALGTFAYQERTMGTDRYRQAAHGAVQGIGDMLHAYPL